MLRLIRRYEPWAPGAALVAVAFARPWLESTMARHMAIELPLLFAIGWLASRPSRPAPDAGFSSWNVSGTPALLAALFVSAFWMLPVALDAAVLDWRLAVVKAASLVAAGFATGWNWRRSGTVVQAFFLFNWCSMNLTAGLLYQGAPQQLCSVYLADQQEAAGRALVVWAIAVLTAWLAGIGADQAGSGRQHST